MKRKFEVIGHEHGKQDIEYIITVKEKGDNRVFTLSYSDSSIWTNQVRGTQILRLIDDGNGIKMESAEGMKFKKGIDYVQFTELRILMDFVQNYEKGISDVFKINEVTQFCEV